VTEVRGDDVHDIGDGFEYEDLRPELSRRRKIVILLLSIVTVLALLAGAIGLWAHRQLFPSGSTTANETVLDVPTGSSTNSIADLLEKKGVISNAFLFKLYVRWKGAGPFKAGSYRFPQDAPADDVVHTLEAGPLPPPTKRFTVPPGLNVRQIPAQVVKDIPTLSVDKLNQAMTDGQIRSIFQPQGQGIEGFLFPDTYDIGQGADERAVVQTMVAQFDKVAAEVGLQDAQARVGHSPYEALIVASLVEEEAKVDEDRPKIARVIYNRLAQGTPLGVDATLCYLKNERPCVLHESDLALDSPYNTRRNPGLPPTPIASVSKASLVAALNPDPGDELYYVLDPNLPPGHHFFTASAAEFEAAKARCHNAGLGCD
jgi:peptidoglycan lytic transglycosylase G